MKPHSLLCHHNLSTIGYTTYGGIGVAAVPLYTIYLIALCLTSCADRHIIQKVQIHQNYLPHAGNY